MTIFSKSSSHNRKSPSKASHTESSIHPSNPKTEPELEKDIAELASKNPYIKTLYRQKMEWMTAHGFRRGQCREHSDDPRHGDLAPDEKCGWVSSCNS